ncbi:MAG: hypothetical protein KBS60_00340, partial [Phascolarctobacterium sp.]|nr:hypothetical protein [Candidatus Phascolarctobacterium caballi]
MKKKFLGKKVLVSLLAGGMLYSGGALLPDYAVDKVGQLLPGMLNVAMADDYRDITDHIKFDLALSAEPDPVPDPPNDYHWIGEKTLKMTGEYTVTLKGTSKTLGLSITENSGSVVIESGASITVGADRYIYPLVKIGSGDTGEASLTAKANQLVGGVLLQKNSVLNLDAGTFDGTIQATGGGNVDNYTAKIVVSGNVIFKDESAIKFGKSKPRGSLDNSKVLEIATGAELTIRADKLIFDEGNNLLTNNSSLVLEGGVLGANVITGGTGTTNIQDTVTMNANQVQTTSGGIQLKDGSVLNLTGTTDSAKTTGELQVSITAVSGAKGKVVVGSGQKIKTKAGATTNIGTESDKVDIENAGNVDFTGDIAGNITNSGGDASNVGFKHTGNMLGSITNTGNYEFADTGKSIQKGKISNSGKMLVKGSIAIAEDTNGTITNSGDFTAEKGIAAKKIINNVGGTFTATGGTNALNITNGIENKLNATMTIEGTLTGGLIDNSGTLTINGPVGNDIHNQSTGTVTAGTGALSGAVDNDGDFTVDAGNISTVSFDNSGTLHLGGADGVSSGKLTKGIVDGQSTKTGVLEITGTDVVVDSGVSAITQKSLTIADGAKLTTDLDKLTISDKYITNKGTLVVSDDSILTIDIKDSNGTTELTSGKKLVVGEDHTIEGTLKGNGGTIDMTERGLGVLKSDTELQKLENAEIHSLTIGKLVGGLNLKIDVDMANFTADKLIVGAADYASLTLSSINVIKDYIPQKDDYGTDDFEINVPTVIDGIHGDDTKAQNAITFVDGEGANNVNCTMGGGTSATGILGEKVPTYNSEPTLTEVITNNYKYTFAMGDTKGTLDYKVEQLNVMFKDFIEGTLPGYGTADGDNKEVDPSILCLTENMTINKEDPDVAIVADMNNAAQKNAELKINLNGKTLDAQTTATDGITVKVGDAKKLNINGGGETAACIITDKVNFDVAEGGALVFDGKTEIYGKINNAADGNVVNAKSGILELKGEIANAGTITNKAEGDSLGRMTITYGGVTGTGKIVNNGQLLVGAAIEN